MIQFLSHAAINFTKWDNCLVNSPDARVYACADFLNTVCHKWNAWVIHNQEEYQAVLPVPEKRFLGIPYTITPPFVQQLGLFGTTTISPQYFEKILLQLQKSNYVIYPFHSGNCCNYSSLLSSTQSRPNYLLKLNQDYNTIAAKFSKHHKRNIKKSLKEAQRISEETNPDIFAEIHKNMAQTLRPPELNLPLLSKIYRNYSYQKFLLGIRDHDNNLLAAACFLIFKNRVYYLAGLCNQKGRNQRAMFLLFHEVIQRYAGKGFTLDFEGSRIPGVAGFFQGFGAEPEYFCTFYKTKIPLLVQGIRKMKNS